MAQYTPVTRIRLISICMFCIASLFYMYEFALQVSPSTMTTELMEAFSADATLLGFLAGAFYFSYTLMQLPAGLILDRYGARAMLTLASIICTLGALIFSLAINIPTAMVGRVLMGIGGAFAFNSVLYLILRWFPAAYFALFVGFLQVLCTVGAIGGGSALARLTDIIGWHHAMLVMSFIGFVIILLSWAFIRNQPYDKAIVTQEEVPIFKNLKEILSNPQTWFIATYSISIWAPMVGFSALWGVPFLKLSCHLTNITAANAVALTWIGAAATSPLLGWLSDVIHRRKMLLAAVALIGSVALATLIFVPHLSITSVYLLLFLVGVSASGQSLIFAVVKDINRVESACTANGFNNMAATFGGLLFQPLIGKILDTTWDGILENGERIYSLQNYHRALLILPICSIMAVLVSTFLIKETFCRSSTGVR